MLPYGACGLVELKIYKAWIRTENTNDTITFKFKTHMIVGWVEHELEPLPPMGGGC